MPSDDGAARPPRVLDPLVGGHAALADDPAVVDALVAAEVALVRASAALGFVPASTAAGISQAFGWVPREATCRGHGIDPAELAVASPASGSPVLALVAAMRARAGDEYAPAIHRGATSQDIVDTALMLVASQTGAAVVRAMDAAAADLRALAAQHRDVPAVARTLTQHAGPTTVGLRVSNWARGLERASAKVSAALDDAPAQLGGAVGTLASFVEIASQAPGGPDVEDIAAALPAAFAAELGLAAPVAPWHTTRWPITELGDALVQAVDACGAFAADVAALSRTEVGELSTGAGGLSTAMPHKRNPTPAILVRAGAIRAPHLGAALHSAASLAADERPDGAWHAEWPVLQDLLRLALGATATTAELAAALAVDTDRTAANLASAGPALLSERVSLVLTPVLGLERTGQLIAEAVAGADLAELLAAEPGLDGVDLDDLLDPASATGLAARLADQAPEERE